MSVSIIVTILNEEKTIIALLEALRQQTYPFREVIVVDGGSTDQTVQLVSDYILEQPSFPLRFIQQAGNRSVGRNRAISEASSNWIAITDAGCLPQPQWLEELMSEQKRSGSPVVAGYYGGAVTSPFTEAVIPYVLVMPDRLNPKEFLPATRSMLISKKTWDQLGGFDEALADNEDYAFARLLKQLHIPIAFAQRAIVTWIPRTSLKSFFWMIFRFAWGDAQAQLWRPKVGLIFARYLVAILLIIGALFSTQKTFQTLVAVTLLLGGTAYLLWAIIKNYRYTPRGWYWLPVLQVVSDFAVMTGTLAGLSSTHPASSP